MGFGMKAIRWAVLGAALLGAALTVAVPAHAQPVDSVYVGAGAGYNLLQDLTTSVDALPGRAVGQNGVTASAPMRVRFGGGYVADTEIGWGLGNGARIELEGQYRENGESRGGGQQTQVGVMTNLLYDINFGLDWMVPYVGIGGGYQAVTWRHIAGQARGIDTSSPTSVGINQTIGGLAYQFIAGVAFPIESVPGLSLTAEYRYENLAVSRAYRATGATPGVTGFASNVTRVHAGDDSNHSVLFGLRYVFDGVDGDGPIDRPPPAPPLSFPPPVPAPPPSPSVASATPVRTYLLFFDWNSTDLSPRARQIIAEAVHAAEVLPRTRIEVAGHADRTGSEEVNQHISMRRAEVVAAEMEKQGVSQGEIDIHAFGDTRLLVPTPPGVRQRQNRRVEIIYR
jgi:outer membrane protein OmpA-like peptidoglycan-associated protein